MILLLHLRNLCIAQSHKDFLRMLSFQSFIVVIFAIMSVIDFELVFVNDVKHGSRVIFIYMDVQLFWHRLLKKPFFFLQWILFVLLLTIDSISINLFLHPLLMHRPVFWPVPQCLRCCSAMDWMFVFPQNSCVEALVPIVVAPGSKAFGRCLGQEGEALLNGISAIIRRDVREMISLSLSCEDTVGRCPPANREEGSHQTPNLPAPWFWTSQASELWEINFCCLSHPV